MKLTCVGAYTDGKCLWVPSGEINALYKMDISKRNIKYIGKFPDCWNDMSWRIRKVFEYHDEVFFFSTISYQIWRLEKATKEIETYNCWSQSIVQITNVEIVQNKAWIIPNNFISPIICFDLQKKEGKVLQWNNEQYWKYGTGSFTRTVRFEDKIYFATRNKEDIHLCVLNCVHKKMMIHDIRELSLINCIGVKDDKLWIFGENRERKNIFLEYDVHTLQCVGSYLSVLSEKLMEKGGLQYFSMGIMPNSIMLIPAWAKKIILYDLDSNEERYIEYPDDFASKLKTVSGVVFNEMMLIEGRMFFMPYLIPKLLVLDVKSLTFETLDMAVSEKEYAKAFKEFCIVSGKHLNESRCLSVEHFCKAMRQEEASILRSKPKNTGIKIFENM